VNVECESVAKSLTCVLCEVKIQRITGPYTSSARWDFDLLKNFEFVTSLWGPYC
jgi:hypothetical protein